MNSKNPLTLAGLETVYDALAASIDRAGVDKSELLLVKLALLAAREIGDEALFTRLIETAQQNL